MRISKNRGGISLYVFNIVHIVSQFHAFKKQVADCDGLANMNLLVAHLRTAYISFVYYMAVGNEIKCLLVINFCLSMTSSSIIRIPHHPHHPFTWIYVCDGCFVVGEYINTIWKLKINVFLNCEWCMDLPLVNPQEAVPPQKKCLSFRMNRTTVP